jgi:hypothetical protein
VARLVAQGLTNRQIAEELFLSPKNVSIHLERIYRKLGVSWRAAVAVISPGRGTVAGSPPLATHKVEDAGDECEPVDIVDSGVVCSAAVSHRTSFPG